MYAVVSDTPPIGVMRIESPRNSTRTTVARNASEDAQLKRAVGRWLQRSDTVRFS